MIINSLLDTDFYCLTTQQLLFHKYQRVHSVSEFKSRGNEDLTHLAAGIQYQVGCLLQLKFTDSDIHYIRSLGMFADDYLIALKDFTFEGCDINISVKTGKLTIKISGPEWKCVLLEVPILAIVNELYFRGYPDTESADRLQTKIDQLHYLNDNEFKFAEFGTRRRYSLFNQRYVLSELMNQVPNNLMGTSNVMLAKELGLKPIGTMGHRYLQMFQGLVHPRLSQTYALSEWLVEHDGRLSIVLTDTINMQAFLNDFTLTYAKVYDGLRHDSGDPFVWGDEAIRYYESLGIDPKSKTLVFSDGLTIDKAIDIYQHFITRTNPIFGIGTSLTNDTGNTPLRIVIKVTEVNGLPVAKISDSPGKSLCKSESYINYLKEIFNV